jgi:ComF family protein
MDASDVIRHAGRVASALLDVLYPRRCFACDADLEGEGSGDLCAGCRATLVPVLNPCPRCASPRGPYVEGRRCGACRALRPGFAGAVAAAEYLGPVVEMVLGLKYAGERFQAYALGDLLATVVRDAPFVDRVEAIVPVPLGRARRRERGYNQAALLAAEVGRALRLPIRERGLIRVRATLPQAGLSRAARLRNLEGCFSARTRAVRGRTILLVDDVMTTGTTVSEAARTLKRAGARAVFAAVAARA